MSASFCSIPRTTERWWQIETKHYEKYTLCKCKCAFKAKNIKQNEAFYLVMMGSILRSAALVASCNSDHKP